MWQYYCPTVEQRTILHVLIICTITGTFKYQNFILMIIFGFPTRKPPKNLHPYSKVYQIEITGCDVLQSGTDNRKLTKE